MSRTRRGSKGYGEYWKSRYKKYGYFEDYGPTTKKLTHKKERKENKKKGMEDV